MSRALPRPKRVPYRDYPRNEIDELARQAAESQAQQHAANAHRSLLVGVGVSAVCIVIVVGNMLFGLDNWLTPIFRLSFGGG